MLLAMAFEAQIRRSSPWCSVFLPFVCRARRVRSQKAVDNGLSEVIHTQTYILRFGHSKQLARRDEIHNPNTKTFGDEVLLSAEFVIAFKLPNSTS